MLLSFQIEMSGELVLQFNGNEYIEYVIKERFKRDYLIKHLVDDEKGVTNKDLINIKFKTQDDGVLMFIIGQTGYIMLQVCMECCDTDLFSSCYIYTIFYSFIYFSNLDKRQKAGVPFQGHTVRTSVRVHCGLSRG